MFISFLSAVLVLQHLSVVQFTALGAPTTRRSTTESSTTVQLLPSHVRGAVEQAVAGLSDNIVQRILTNDSCKPKPVEELNSMIAGHLSDCTSIITLSNAYGNNIHVITTNPSCKVDSSLVVSEECRPYCPSVGTGSAAAHELVDLGEHYWPRYVLSPVCSGELPGPNNGMCAHSNETINLVVLERAGGCDNENVQRWVPATGRPSITVGCNCRYVAA